MSLERILEEKDLGPNTPGPFNAGLTTGSCIETVSI